ncbi:MAG: heavy metal-binding domain-containing protein, partial [Phycisphaeraceae bacterium]|nr:heavy metal-binding domain-containing protein [Phycisphaeraceae bacterium]
MSECCGKSGQAEDGGDDSPAAGDEVVDPVCGMTVDPQDAADEVVQGEERWYFCSERCAEMFRQQPEAYIGDEEGGGEKKASAEEDPHGIYTCPMHPEVRRVGPGDCPECGMALEPVAGGDEVEEGSVLTWRFWLAAVLSLPVVARAMGSHLPGWPGDGIIGPDADRWIEMGLTTVVVLVAGWPLLVRGVRSIINRRPNMFTLVGTGVAAAWGYSLAALVAPGLFPESVRGHDGQVGVYFEAAAVITTLVLLGQVLEERARRSTRGAVRELMDLAAQTARRINESGEDEEVDLAEVEPGDRLRVKPGEKVPVDGVIEEGSS